MKMLQKIIDCKCLGNSPFVLVKLQIYRVQTAILPKKDFTTDFFRNMFPRLAALKIVFSKKYNLDLDHFVICYSNTGCFGCLIISLFVTLIIVICYSKT